jgi:hypothetical protein
VDSREVPVQTVRKLYPALGAGLCLASVVLAGCGGRPRKASQPLAGRLREQLAARKADERGSLSVKGTGNTFVVESPKGLRILEAQVETMGGTVMPSSGLEGPVRMLKARCKLFQDGKPQMELESPEATWDGKHLTSDKPTHAVTSDGTTVIDSQKTVWTAETGHLALEQTKLQALKGGQPDFTAEAPKAEVHRQVATMPSGAVGRNPSGQQLKADRMRWHMDSSRLEADGNVEVIDEGTRITGDHLAADTKLKKGLVTGNTRIHMKRGLIAKKKNG